MTDELKNILALTKKLKRNKAYVEALLPRFIFKNSLHDSLVVEIDVTLNAITKKVTKLLDDMEASNGND